MKLNTKVHYNDEITNLELNNRKLSFDAASEGIVLLENDGVLPLINKNIALFGMGSIFTTKGGTGSGEVNERYSVNIFDGLVNLGCNITSLDWINDLKNTFNEHNKKAYKQNRKTLYSFNFDKIMEMMNGSFLPTDIRNVKLEDIEKSKTDTCLYVISRQAGEGGDRRLIKGDYYLTDNEYSDIKLCAKNYKNFILIINAGGQIDLSFVDEIDGINGILFVGQLGSEGGNALANILYGKINPSGKLSDTWVFKYEDYPFANEYGKLNKNLDFEYYKEGIYVGYRYFDSFNVPVRYPFGYGLSYSKFKIDFIKSDINGRIVNIYAKCKNIGKFAGKEVIQVYVSSPKGTLDKEYQSLVAFNKTSLLNPDEEVEIKLSFDLKQIASYDENSAYFILEKGLYRVRIGNSSKNTHVVTLLSLDKEILVSKHQNICQRKFKVSELVSKIKEENNKDVTILKIDSNAFSTIEYKYGTHLENKDLEVQKLLNKLSIRQMIDIVVGAGFIGGKPYFNLPGSVGNTTSKYIKMGIPNVTLCDGPAGLRIQKRSALKNGKIKMIDAPLSIYDLLPKIIKKFLFGNLKKDKIVYQFTTAFPVHTVLAQTFNSELVYQVGKAINKEMEEYGCTYWLAPALNIHRNPLCGRNFEYFSEDPFLTGIMASMLTKGVQSQKGYYVTIKHFACNNQEDNRNNVSSEIDERALREIYLKGFEMAIKSNALGVMTSYNKINGIYTSNNYDLCTRILRNEWNFKGVVMTDWFSTNKGHASSAMAMSSGNDLIMPGGKYYKKEILKGLKKGKCNKEDIRRCCSNVLYSILNSNIYREFII